jgi:DNA-directed RNA polymerase subunit H (RpoH/RPB5)
VRPHIRVKKEESNLIKKKFGVDKLPVILTSDPVVRYFNFRPGEIIAITRKGGFVSYRIVK